MYKWSDGPIHPIPCLLSPGRWIHLPAVTDLTCRDGALAISTSAGRIGHGNYCCGLGLADDDPLVNDSLSVPVAATRAKQQGQNYTKPANIPYVCASWIFKNQDGDNKSILCQYLLGDISSTRKGLTGRCFIILT